METIFPSSNWLGIPDLDPDLAADRIPLPVWACGSVARSRENLGTWHFYVDDRRFAPVLEQPERMLRTRCRTACEPNVSAYDDTPLATVLAGIYKKRWAARAWQSFGVRILVDVNLPPRALERDEWRFGVPDGWRAFSTRGYEQRVGDLDTEYETAVRVRGSTSGLLFLVVGGGRKTAEWCAGKPGVIHSGYQSTREVYKTQLAGGKALFDKDTESA